MTEAFFLRPMQVQRLLRALFYCLRTRTSEAHSSAKRKVPSLIPGRFSIS